MIDRSDDDKVGTWMEKRIRYYAEDEGRCIISRQKLKMGDGCSHIIRRWRYIYIYIHMEDKDDTKGKYKTKKKKTNYCLEKKLEY